MQYLVLGVDVYGIPLKVEGEIPSKSWPVKISKELQDELMMWNNKFSSIISAEHLYSENDRKAKCITLNEEGERLACRVADELDGEVKVKYLME